MILLSDINHQRSRSCTNAERITSFYLVLCAGKARSTDYAVVSAIPQTYVRDDRRTTRLHLNSVDTFSKEYEFFVGLQSYLWIKSNSGRMDQEHWNINWDYRHLFGKRWQHQHYRCYIRKSEASERILHADRKFVPHWFRHCNFHDAIQRSFLRAGGE